MFGFELKTTKLWQDRQIFISRSKFLLRIGQVLDGGVFVVTLLSLGSLTN